MKVYLNNYKTKKVNGDIDFEVEDKELVKLFNKYYVAIKAYFKDADFNHWLLFDINKNKVSRNDYTRLLNKTFELSGKRISSSLIRKIVLSELYPKHKKVFEKITEDIVFSRQMAKAHYPSDIDFGKKLAKSMFKYLKDNDLIS
jgi:hypothetical protein